METALEVTGYEPEEDAKVTAAVIKKTLKELIDDLKRSEGSSARKELKSLQTQDKAIKAIENRIKDTKTDLKTKTDELTLKLQLKRLGGEEFKAENLELIRQVDAQLAELDPKNKAEKKKITALSKDKAALNARLAKTDAILAAIGGQLTGAEARELILKKIYDLVTQAIRSFWDGDIVWVTPNDLSKLKTPYLSASAKRITEKGLKGCSAIILPQRSLVMSSRAPIGYVALPVVPFCTNQGCKTIKLKDAFHPEFVYYNVLFNIGKVKNLGEGTTFAEISKTALSSVELTFPSSKPEQTKIAEILSTVDRAIEQTEALIAKQQRIKTGLMQDLLTRGIDEHGNLRSEQTHQFQESPHGRIPVGWEAKKLGNSSEVCNNFRKPIAALVRENMKGDYPYYGPTGVPDQFIGTVRVTPLLTEPQEAGA